ncbi:sigma-70 family RNA polymerase sigma factor [Streptomyces zhihengii]|uniref:sigma-70 family RNA polymerase sigma factor n=1 Tax=Streptomyces zhihengii TaxID=1818004 RepID=UPI0033B37DD2
MHSDEVDRHHVLDEAACAFLLLRPRLWAVAYRVLGNPNEAEDVIQDVWIRWQKTDRSRVVAPPAFLVRVTTRLAINVARSARARREECAGLTEMMSADTSVHLEGAAEQAEALEGAVLLLLERLGPTERAAYVLREAFDYPYGEIADILQHSEASARQLVSRARKHLTGDRRTSVTSLEHRRLLRAFLVAARAGDMTPLERVLTGDFGNCSGAPAANRASVYASSPVAAA